MEAPRIRKIFAQPNAALRQSRNASAAVSSVMRASSRLRLSIVQKTPQSGHGSDHGGKTQMLVDILHVDLGGQISLIASVVSISAAAVQSAQTFCDLVQSIKDAPAELNVISADTETFYIIVDDLRAALSEEQIKDRVKYDEHMVMRVGKLELPLTRCLELLDQLKAKIRSYLKTADYGQVWRFGNMERGRWFFTKNKVNELVVSLNASKVTLNTAMASITMLCTLRLEAAGLKTKVPASLVRQDAGETDAGSALRLYVKEASIAGSLAPSMQNLSVNNVPEHTLVPGLRTRTPPLSLLHSSDATERVRKADNQRTALHKAAKSGLELDIVEILLESGADVNAKTADGTTALHLAAQYGNENTARVLLEHGANVHARIVPPRDDPVGRIFLGGRTPLHWAAVEGYDAIVELLLDHNADPGAKNTTYRTPLQEAIMHGHELVARTLIKRGAPIDDQDDEAWTPLHQSSDTLGLPGDHPGRVAIAKLLLDSGAHIDAVTADTSIWGNKFHHRSTPLLLAAWRNAIENVTLLIERGADLRACKKEGEMAIHVAALEGHIVIVRMLLDADVEVDIRDRLWNETPLLKAAQRDHLPVLQLLQERGADLRARNHGGEMAIHLAALYGHVNVIRMMLDSGVEIDIRDPGWNETALHKAAAQDRWRATQLLLENGADPRAVNKLGRDVLQHTMAVKKNGNPEIMRLLKERLDVLRTIDEKKRQKGLEELKEQPSNENPN